MRFLISLLSPFICFLFYHLVLEFFFSSYLSFMVKGWVGVNRFSDHVFFYLALYFLLLPLIFSFSSSPSPPSSLFSNCLFICLFVCFFLSQSVS